MACTCEVQSVTVCADLVRGTLAGNRDAFAELLQKFTPLVRYLARKYSTAHLTFDGDDAVQNLALHLLTPRQKDQVARLTLWSQQSQFCRWLGSVVTRLFLTKQRGWNPLQQGPEESFQLFEPSSSDSRPESDLERRDRLAAVERKVAQFPIDHQIVFWNHFMHGLTYAELGRILDKNERVLRRWMTEIFEQISEI